MGVFAGPDISESGLVLALDAGNSKGFDSDENLLTYSEQLDNSVWANTGYGTLATVTPNTIIAPNGSLTADTINFAPNATNQSRRIQIVSNMSGTYTVSAHVKKGNMSSISLYVTTAQSPYPSVAYNFDTDTVSGTGATRTLLSDGWVRISCTATVTTHTGYVGFIGFSTGFTYAWGLQLEKRSSLTNYYTTTNTTKLAGTTWTDLSGNGNNGTLVNGVGYNSGNGGSLSFDGTNDYVTLPQSFTFGTSTFSIECWVNADTLSGIDAIYYSQSSNAPGFYGVGHYAGSGGFYLSDFSGSTRITTFFGSDAVVNTWYHLVFLKNSSNQYVVYRNAVASTTNNTSTTSLSSSDPRIGYNPASGSEIWDGKIANFKIYNRALTPQEIQQNFIATRRRFGI